MKRKKSSFRAATDPEQWIQEGTNSLHGARGVPLADIVKEHREQLKNRIDARPTTIRSGCGAPYSVT
jgi:hypothetical protein